MILRVLMLEVVIGELVIEVDKIIIYSIVYIQCCVGCAAVDDIVV